MKKQLPVVNSPTLVCTLPVSKQKIKYRPFIVKEQKAMLLAQQSEDEQSIAQTVRDVVISCTNGTMDYDNTPTADVAYFFLQMQISSVGTERKVSIPCVKCEEPILMNIDLSSITVDTSNVVTQVMITESIGVTFRLPSMTDTSESMKNVDGVSRNESLITRLIVSIFDEDSVYPFDEYTAQEKSDWLSSLNDVQLMEIQKFVDGIPELRHELKYSCPHCQTKQRKLLEGLHGFFRLGNDQ